MKLVEVCKAYGELDAQLLCALLEDNGIECMIRGEALRLTHGITVNGLAEVKVLVRPEDAGQAREIIAAQESMLKCSECGKFVRTDDDVCWFCGEQFDN